MRTLRLVTQTRDSIYFSHPYIFLDFSCEFCLVSPKKGTIWCRVSSGVVYTKTIIHLVQSRWWVVDIYLPASRLGKYSPLFTTNSVNNCLIVARENFMFILAQETTLRRLTHKGLHASLKKITFLIWKLLHHIGTEAPLSLLFTTQFLPTKTHWNLYFEFTAHQFDLVGKRLK